MVSDSNNGRSGHALCFLRFLWALVVAGREALEPVGVGNDAPTVVSYIASAALKIPSRRVTHHEFIGQPE
jgi:hypothetical protein